MNEYNSEVCRIRSLLKFRKEDLTEHDFLEKTYSTFHATNIVMQKQNRAHNFMRLSNLIYVLTLAEKNSHLLMKNHQERPTNIEAKTNSTSMVGTTRALSLSRPPRVKRAETHPREEIQPRNMIS